MTVTICGFCGGKGYVFGPAYDREGRAQPPPQRCCEYCLGNGQCEGGDMLLAAIPPNVGPDHAADMARAGLPPWA